MTLDRLYNLAKPSKTHQRSNSTRVKCFQQAACGREADFDRRQGQRNSGKVFRNKSVLYVCVT